MSSVVIAGDVSGSVTLQAPSAAGSTVLTLPSTSGTVVVTGGAQTIEFADGSASAPSITNSGDTNTGMFFPAADTIAFTEGGTESMRIDASGNLGIGTSSPTQRLQVAGSQLLSSPGNSVYTYFDSTASWVGRDSASGALVFGANSSERMRIDTSGNVLVGTTTSSGKLTAYTATADATDMLHLQRISSGTFRVRSPSGGLVLAGSPFADAVGFETNATERARFNSGGDFMVGMTSIAYSPTVGFGVSPTGAGGGTWISIGHPNGTGNGNAYIGFAFNGTAIGAVVQNTTSSVAYNTTSDYRLKENVQPMVGALEKVEQLNPVTFTWIKGQEPDSGFIAHELQAIIPNVVSGEKDAVNDEGDIVPQSVDYGKLTAVLTAAIQELKAIVDEQAEKIKALEAQLNA